MEFYRKWKEKESSIIPLFTNSIFGKLEKLFLLLNLSNTKDWISPTRNIYERRKETLPVLGSKLRVLDSFQFRWFNRSVRTFDMA